MMYIMVGREIQKVDDVYMWGHWMQWMSKHGARHVGKVLIPPRKPLRKNKTRKGPGRANFRSLHIINKHRACEVCVSTVFLGVDHAYSGKPITFETMIFGGKYDQYQRRYYTVEQAKQGHQEALELVK